MPLTCHHCKKEFPEQSIPSIGFRETCPGCATDMHVCMNCAFYDEGAYHECRESQAEWVKDKVKWNRCEYFRGDAKRASSGAEDAAKKFAALDDLFKK